MSRQRIERTAVTCRPLPLKGSASRWVFRPSWVSLRRSKRLCSCSNTLGLEIASFSYLVTKRCLPHSRDAASQASAKRRRPNELDKVRTLLGSVAKFRWRRMRLKTRIWLRELASPYLYLVRRLRCDLDRDQNGQASGHLPPSFAGPGRAGRYRHRRIVDDRKGFLFRTFRGTAALSCPTSRLHSRTHGG